MDGGGGSGGDGGGGSGGGDGEGDGGGGARMQQWTEAARAGVVRGMTRRQEACAKGDRKSVGDDDVPEKRSVVGVGARMVRQNSGLAYGSWSRTIGKRGQKSHCCRSAVADVDMLGKYQGDQPCCVSPRESPDWSPSKVLCPLSPARPVGRAGSWRGGAGNRRQQSQDTLARDRFEASSGREWGQLCTVHCVAAICWHFVDQYPLRARACARLCP